MKICVVHPWGKAKWANPVTHDGLFAALDLIAKDHQVDWYLGDDRPKDEYDWIIPWGVMSIPFNDTIQQYSGKKAIFCAGHPQDTANIEKFDVVFVESPEVKRLMDSAHPNIQIAFGTDTDYFKPQKEEKVFDAFFPATYSPWKRQDLFAEATRGYRALTCGYIQPDGIELWQSCSAQGGYTMGGLVPTRLIATLYNMSKCVVITAWHGSERTALEAMSSNTPLVVTKDNELVCSLLTKECITVDPDPVSVRRGMLEAITRSPQTRKYVLHNYSHYIYAENILKYLR